MILTGALSVEGGWEAALVTVKSTFPREKSVHTETGENAPGGRECLDSAATFGDGKGHCWHLPCSWCEHTLVGEM